MKHCPSKCLKPCPQKPLFCFTQAKGTLDWSSWYESNTQRKSWHAHICKDIYRYIKIYAHMYEYGQHLVWKNHWPYDKTMIYHSQIIFFCCAFVWIHATSSHCIMLYTNWTKLWQRQSSHIKVLEKKIRVLISKARFSSPLLGTQSFYFSIYYPSENIFLFALNFLRLKQIIYHNWQNI